MIKRIMCAEISILAVLTILFISQASGTNHQESRYRPYNEVVYDLEMVANNNPEFVTLHNLSEEYSAPLTHQNRSLIAVRITDPDQDENEPGILITGAHHAREWISVEVPLYFIHYLVDNYLVDPYVTFLIENRDIWIIPVVNPDGYVKSWEDGDRDHNWTGWRKNSRDNNGDGIIDNRDGVDLNRNYGYMWGFDDINSSPDPANEFYRGPAPFSEPETQAIRNLTLQEDFAVSLHYHSYGEMNIYPWGYSDLDTGDHETFVMMGQQMSRYNGYIYNNSNNSDIYNVNGDVTDWLYSQSENYAFTVELGTKDDKYIPDESRIRPISEENLYVNLFTCFIADNPAAVNFHLDPEGPSPLSNFWDFIGDKGNWTIVEEGIIGESSWHISPEVSGNTSAEVLLNYSLNSAKGNRYLVFWNKYKISDGTELLIGLRDGSGNLSTIEKIRYQEGQRGDEESGGSEWGIRVINLTPFLSDSKDMNLTFVFVSNGTGTDSYWNIDAITITSKEPELPLSFSLSGTPRAHIDRITPWNPLHTDTLTIVGHGTDDGEIVRYVWSIGNGNESYNGTDPSFTIEGISNGTHFIFLKVQDDDGLWSHEVEFSFAINGKPSATIEDVSPNPIVEGNELTFACSGTDDGQIIRYMWLLGDEEIYNGTKPTFTTSNLKSGNHMVFLRVMDNNGAISDTVNMGLLIEPDSDRDGIIDSEDAFPEDSAASIDTDGDGYPDEWNQGKRHSNSTTGLKIDSYPNDPDKWEKEDESGFLPGFEIVILFISILISFAMKRGRK